MSTTEEIAVWRARLAEAEAALHAMEIGQAVVEVEYDGRRTRFSVYENGRERLEQYIAKLKALIAGRPLRRRLSIGFGN